MGFEKILQKYPSLIVFGGKGGVGKTTCAAVTATYLSQSLKTLLISSDPAPCLSGIFRQKIGARVVRIEGATDLFATEIDRPMVIKRWKAKFAQEVYQVASALFPVGKEVIDYVSEAPGIDEEFLLDYVLEIVESKEYDKIVWDTAPAGHTLRLLRFPEVFSSHLNVAAGVYYKIAVNLQKIKRVSGGSKDGPRTIVETLENWRRLAEKVQQMLRDNQKTEFIIVTDAESMPVKLSKSIYDDLEREHIHVGHIVVNNMVSEEGGYALQLLLSKKKDAAGVRSSTQEHDCPIRRDRGNSSSNMEYRGT